MDVLLQDVRVGARALLRNRSTTIVAILCLALGIGANAAIFSVVNSALLRPLPYASPERVANIWETFKTGGGDGWGSVSFPNYRDWRDQNRVFSSMAAYQWTSLNLQGTGEPERVRAIETTDNLFSVLGTAPLLGRTFVAGEDQPDRRQVAVLSEQFWQRRFGGDPSIVGRSVVLDGESYAVIGVMPNRFTFPGRDVTDVFVPLTPSPQQAAERGSHGLQVIARLAPGIEMPAAHAQMRELAARIEKAYPDEQTGRSVRMESAPETAVGRVRPALLILLSAVALVLLIACANVANLLLARAAARRRDVAIRIALGAGRGRLVRQFLTESVLLAFVGAALGAVLAHWSLKALTTMSANYLPSADRIGIDGTVFLYLLATAVVTGLGFGIVPALQASGGDLRDTLNDAGVKTTAGTGHQRFRSALVIAEIALSLVLLIGAGLLMRAFVALNSTEPGLVAENVLTLHIAVPPSATATDSTIAPATALLQPVLQRIRAIPGVRAAGAVTRLPIQSWGTNGDFTIAGRAEPPPDQSWLAELRVTTPGFFESLGIPLIAGRAFTEQDGRSGAKVAIINKALADKYFEGDDPIGRGIRRGGDDIYTIVGVVADVRQAGLDQAPRAEISFPYTDRDYGSWMGDVTLTIKTSVPPASITRQVREAVQSVAPSQPIFSVRTMEEVIARSLADRRLYLWLLATFAAIALVLSAAGIYGVISYLVTQRTREIGIRMALGAKAGDVMRLVVRQGAGLTAAGIAIGLLGALALTRVLASMLYGVSARDPITFAAVALMLGAVAILATFIPARRAARVDPLVALRSE